MMLRNFPLNIFKRLYHDSNFARKAPSNAVKLANSRVRRTVQRRLDSEAQPRVESYDPSKRFEPFPFAITEENRLEIMRGIVEPLHDTPYEEQLASKESFCRNSLRYFAQQLYKIGTPVRLDVRRLPCNVNPIERSPQISKYRNKDSFSIWRGLDGKTNTVGFMAFPISKHGDTICIEPNGSEIMRDEVARLADILQEFIRNQAKLPVCYTLGTEGGWRRFSVRSNGAKHLMLTGFLNPRTFTVQSIVDERANFKEFIVRRSKEAGIDLKSLYFQPCHCNHCNHEDVPYELLYGDKTLLEEINGLMFAVSPISRFHENSSGIEVLNKTVKKVMDECFSFDGHNTKPLILDVNCGIGVLTLDLASLASKVVGINTTGQVEEAQFNAQLNGIENCEFIGAHLEIVLQRVLEKHSKARQDILVVCDAGRLGQHPHAIEALRNCGDVKKMIYITAKVDGEAAIKDLMGLCKKVAGKSIPPFAPISATPVDMYPNLRPCDVVIALERVAD